MNILWGYIARQPQSLTQFLETAKNERVVNRKGVSTEFASAAVVDFSRPVTCYTDPEKRYTCWRLGYTLMACPLGDEPMYLFEGWLQYGREFFSDCHGSYLVVIYDSLTEAFHIITDPYGTRTLFYNQTEAGIGFGSRPEQVRHTPGFVREVNTAAIVEYLLTGFVLGDHTFDKNIQMIPPATEAIISKQGIEVRKYSPEPFCLVREDVHLEQAANIFMETFSQVLEQIVHKNKPQYANLTGGTDSRLILSALTPELRQSLRFTTRQGPWTVGTGTNDCTIASLLAERYALKHEIQTPKNNPVTYKAPYSRYADQVVLVNEPKLCGGFGSELISGSLFHEVWFLKDNLDIDFDRLHQCAEQFSDNQEPHVRNAIEKLQTALRMSTASDPVFELFASRTWRSYYTCIYNYADFTWISPYNRLQGTGIYPFLNTALLSVLYQFPREILKNYALYGYLYKNHLKEFGEFPFHSTFTKLVDGFSVLPSSPAAPAGSEILEATEALAGNRSSLLNLDILSASWDVPEEHWQRRLRELKF